MGAAEAGFVRAGSEIARLIEEGWREPEENGKTEEPNGMIEQLQRALDRARMERRAREARRAGRHGREKPSEKDMRYIEEGWKG